MNREVHVRFWERPEVKALRATRQSTNQPLPRTGSSNKREDEDSSFIMLSAAARRGYKTANMTRPVELLTFIIQPSVSFAAKCLHDLLIRAIACV
jgi:hypothetical protein